MHPASNQLVRVRVSIPKNLELDSFAQNIVYPDDVTVFSVQSTSWNVADGM